MTGEETSLSEPKFFLKKKSHFITEYNSKERNKLNNNLMMSNKKNATPVRGSSSISQNVEQLPQGDTTTIGKCGALMLWLELQM